MRNRSRARLRGIATIAAALAIAALGIGLAVHEFREPETTPFQQPPVGIFDQIRGFIVFPDGDVVRRETRENDRVLFPQATVLHRVRHQFRRSEASSRSCFFTHEITQPPIEDLADERHCLGGRR